MPITPEQLSQIIPGNQYVDQWCEALNKILPDYGIDTPQRQAAFLAQCAHESAGFTALQENLNYRAESLMRVWPRYFPTMEIATQYAHHPEPIANRAYAIETLLEQIPEFLATFEGAIQSAAWFWDTNNLNQYADSGDITTMTRRINGGVLGLDDRIKHYNHALQVLTA